MEEEGNHSAIYPNAHRIFPEIYFPLKIQKKKNILQDQTRQNHYVKAYKSNMQIQVITLQPGLNVKSETVSRGGLWMSKH